MLELALRAKTVLSKKAIKEMDLTKPSEKVQPLGLPGHEATQGLWLR